MLKEYSSIEFTLSGNLIDFEAFIKDHFFVVYESMKKISSLQYEMTSP